MNPHVAYEIARLRQDDMLRDAEHARLVAGAAPHRSLRTSLGLCLVRIGARVAGDDAVVLAAPTPVRAVAVRR